MPRPPRGTSTVSDARAAGRTRRDPVLRRAEVLDHAMAAFASDGFAGTTLQKVATRAGLTTGGFFHYFDTKEQLFEAVVEERLVPTLAATEAMLAAHDGEADALVERLIGALWDTIALPDNAALSMIVLLEAPRFPVVAEIFTRVVIVRWRRVFFEALERAVAAGRFPPALPVEDLSWAVPSMVAGAVLHLQGIGRLLGGPRDGAPDRDARPDAPDGTLAARSRASSIAVLMAGLHAGAPPR